MQGVRVYEGIGVERVKVESGRVRGVHTDQGHIECEIFVNCAGQVSHFILKIFGICVLAINFENL